jgi:hypothetical protein
LHLASGGLEWGVFGSERNASVRGS